MYYTTPSKKSEGVKGYWCHPCYNEHRGEVIELEGLRVRKVTACFFTPVSCSYASCLFQGFSTGGPMAAAEVLCTFKSEGLIRAWTLRLQILTSTKLLQQRRPQHDKLSALSRPF